MRRALENPILKPDVKRFWEGCAVLNPSVVKKGEKIIMLYRAISNPIHKSFGEHINISSIGICYSYDGIHFEDRNLFFGPEYYYEAYGCEDPRVCYFEGKYYIFYTAISDWPPQKEAVKLALAITEDFKNYEKKGIICPFNAKAATIFPERINDKIAVIFTLNPEYPPSRVAIAYFDEIDDLLNPSTWQNHYDYYYRENNLIVLRAVPPQEYVEVGTQPILTDEGWLMIIPWVEGPYKPFYMRAILLDYEKPHKVLKISKPLLIPEVQYEFSESGIGIIMPTGAIVMDEELYVYYGAGDKYICLAKIELDKLLRSLVQSK